MNRCYACNIHYTQQSLLRKLVGLKNSVHCPHVAHEPVVGQRCTIYITPTAHWGLFALDLERLQG